ncbi:MAG TPA: GNAT family N-acetyltransferase [Thermoplasmata archaeon]|nr:GNAT family N-acetyltransferase [Thermoplasmata archaeon]
MATRAVPRPVRSIAEVESFTFGDLSDWFNPFLDRFLRDTLASGGEAWVSIPDGTVEGAFLSCDAERSGSIFTRSPTIARQLYALRDQLHVFSEMALDGPAESWHVLASELPRGSGAHRFSHPVRLAEPSDYPSILRLMSEVLGAVDERWFRLLPRADERCLVVELGGRLAGAAMVSRAGAVGRLHSLVVGPRYRGLGVGADLVQARLAWLEMMGAQQALTEISDRNAVSLRIAERAGLRRVGPMYEYSRVGPRGPPEGEAHVRGAPQFGQALTAGSMSDPQ